MFSFWIKETVDIEAYKEPIVKKEENKRENWRKKSLGLFTLSLECLLMYISYILKKIKNMDLYRLIPYLYSFNRKPTIYGLTPLICLFIYLYIYNSKYKDKKWLVLLCCPRMLGPTFLSLSLKFFFFLILVIH